MQTIEEVVAAITALEEERETIYADDRVTAAEHPRLAEINKELERLWDLRRRIEAARSAGLDRIPVDPPEDPSKLIG
jgi:hypothetical protein